MFKVKRRDPITNIILYVDVYAVNKNVDTGVTEFLVFVDGEWKWEDPKLFIPTEEPSTLERNV